MRMLVIAGAVLAAAMGSAQAGERAWLAVETAEVQWDDGLQIAVKIRNVGATPAIDMVASERIGSIKRDSSQTWYEAFPRETLSPLCSKPVGNAGMVWQGIGQTYRVNVAALDRSPKTPYVHGCFVYRSAAGGPQHSTEYCFMFSQGKTLRCPWGNSAD